MQAPIIPRDPRRPRRGPLPSSGSDESPRPFHVSPFALIGGHKMYFHASGTSRDTEETLRFAAFTGIRPMIEQAPLADAQPAYERMLTGQARFRMVLVTTH